MLNIKDVRICIIGLGYVGLPLAVEFGKMLPTFGFDVNQQRVDQLNLHEDLTLEMEPDELREATYLQMTTDLDTIKGCNVYIVTVPTPIDLNKQPDLSPLEKASETIGRLLTNEDIVVYESTVYPGVTEDVCVPILEKISGLQFNTDFFVGYSPERINPGDKAKRLPNIVKVTSGSTPKSAELIDNLYKMIITAGTHLAPSIKVAEASKVIENTQRDLNIALVNQLAIIFNRLEIDTADVLAAAGTKWNFLPFRPGWLADTVLMSLPLRPAII